MKFVDVQFAKFIFILFFGFSLISCYEKQEGCLDVLATNFDITVDDACDDCCTFPTVSFQFSHVLGGVKYSSDSIWINDFGQEFKMNRSLVYISDLKLITTDGAVLESDEEALYQTTSGEEIYIKEDHALFKQSDSFKSITSIKENGIIDSVSIDLGIHHNHIALESDRVLFTSDSLYVSDQYYDVVFYLKIGDMFDEDISIRIRNVAKNKTIVNSVESIEKSPRTNIALAVQLDYLEILKSINLEGVSNTLIIEEFEVPSGFLKFN